MKRYRKMFREAERIEPPAGLWKRIEAGAEMQPAGDGDSRAWPGFLSIAATVALAAGLLVLGFGLRPGSEVRTAGIQAVSGTGDGNGSAAADEDAESVVDPDLMVWHADLGELELEAEEAEEVL